MSEEQVKEIIEQVGYQEFYRYFQEKTTLIEQQRKEIERLNNIINELEKFLIQLNTKIKEITNVPFDVKEIMEQLDKLQELKGEDKE